MSEQTVHTGDTNHHADSSYPFAPLPLTTARGSAKELVARSIDQYVPKIPEAHWALIGPFTRSCVARCEHHTPYTAQTMMIVATRLTHWAWQTAGIPLETKYVFRHDVITSFINGLSGLSASTRGTYRSRLMRMADVLLEGEQTTYRLPNLPPSDPSQPYTPAQVVALRSWANGQSTAQRRVDANVLLALTLGAGLSTNEILTATAAQITVDDLGVLVAVTGARTRTVPVLAEWEAVLAQVASSAWKPDMYLFGPRRTSVGPNGVYNFVHRSNDLPFPVSAQRLRATWIVTHLAAATPVQALLDAAGIETLKAIGRFLDFAPAPDPDVARTALHRRARAEGCTASIAGRPLKGPAGDSP